MFKKFLEKLRNWREQFSKAEEIDPSEFLQMATELRELAETASKLWQGDKAYRARAQRILDEMDQLTAIASKPEFRRLSTEKRQELRQSLILSREQLLKSMGASPPATDTIQ